MARATAWPTRKEPLRLTRSTASKSSSVTSKKIRCAEDAGVVHQHIDTAIGSKHLRHQRVHLRLVTHVAAHIQSTQLLRQIAATGVIHIHDDRLGSLGRKTPHTGLTNPLGTARDDANTALEAKVDG